MILFKASRDAILKPLQVVAGIVERRHTLPILANVLLRKEGDTVRFLATDVDIQIETEAQIGSGSEDAQITVSARKLVDILRALPDSDDAPVTLSLGNGRAQLSAGKSRFTLQTLAAADFPVVAAAAEPSAAFELPQKVLRHLFQMVHFSMAQQDIRFYLNGLLLVTDADTVRVVATDGHRLAYCETRLEGATLPQHDVIVPRKSVLELQRLLADSEEPVEIALTSNQARFRFGAIEMITKLVEGKFPDYERVMPSGYTNQLEIDRVTLQSALARAAILTSEKFKGVRLSLSDEGLGIQITNADQEEAREEVAANYYGNPIEVGFNIGYLQDVLGNLKSEKMLIAFGDANSSALVTTEEEPGFRYVVMPMRI
jgi:DNA polymerase-3 subunit beta